MREHDQWLAWIGLAIAVVALNDFGWGPFIRYTLLAVIAYGLLVNIERLEPLIDRFVAGLRMGPRGTPPPAGAAPWH